MSQSIAVIGTEEIAFDVKPHGASWRIPTCIKIKQCLLCMKTRVLSRNGTNGNRRCIKLVFRVNRIEVVNQIRFDVTVYLHGDALASNHNAIRKIARRSVKIISDIQA